MLLVFPGDVFCILLFYVDLRQLLACDSGVTLSIVMYAAF